jgi:sugar phosphate isomerase/epimerase
MFTSWNARAVGLVSTAAEAIELAAGTGFEGVDLMVRDLVLAGESPGALRDRMGELGLQGGGFPLPVQWKGSSRQFAADLADLPRYAEAARVLGLRCTGTWVMPEFDPALDDERRPGGPSIQQQAIAFHLERLGRIARVLEDHQIDFGLEIMGPATFRTRQGPAFIGTYGQLTESLSALKERHGNVGILADAFHLFASGEAVEVVLGWGVERVMWVHVADSAVPDRTTVLDHERLLPGEAGRADCKGLLRLLANQGYQGPVTVEPLSRCASLHGLDPSTVARKALASLRSIWPGKPASNGSGTTSEHQTPTS